MDRVSNRGIITLIIVLVVIMIGYWLFSSYSLATLSRQSMDNRNYLVASPYAAYDFDTNRSPAYNSNMPMAYVNYPIARSTSVSYNSNPNYNPPTYPNYALAANSYYASAPVSEMRCYPY